MARRETTNIITSSPPLSRSLLLRLRLAPPHHIIRPAILDKRVMALARATAMVEIRISKLRM